MTDATTFYDALAPMFDVMTDWEARLAAEGPFLRAVLDAGGARRVLDAACGSGGHALALARWGYDAAGADASPAMISLARRKAAEAGVDVPFAVSGLADLTPPAPLPYEGRGEVGSPVLLKDLTPRPLSLSGKERTGSPPLVGEGLGERFRTEFDAVLCLGNSLPHLLTQNDLVAALWGMAAVLRGGGLLILQNLNYDLRWRTQPRFFAAQGGTLESQEVLVWRFADYDVPAGRIAFHIALFRKALRAEGGDPVEVRGEQGKWDVQVHTTPQRPLFLADLAQALAQAGFEEVRAYGRMAWPAEPFDPDRSLDLVVVARKGTAKS